MKEERLPGRKASCSAAGSGSRGLPPSSPMVSSAHNPNKAEIPERRKDSTSTPVSGQGWGAGSGVRPPVAQPVDATRFTSFRPCYFPSCSPDHHIGLLVTSIHSFILDRHLLSVLSLPELVPDASVQISSLCQKELHVVGRKDLIQGIRCGAYKIVGSAGGAGKRLDLQE